MKYILGNYEFNEVQATFSQQPVRISGSLVRLTVLTHNVKCKLRADTQSALDAMIADAIAALSGPGGDSGLYLDDGTPTQHVILNANTLDGIKLISGPNFTQGAGAEYSLFRTLEFTLEAKIKNNDLNLVQFQESVSVVGGTRPTAWLLPADGSQPIGQRLVKTPYIVTQSGSAESYENSFIFPFPLISDPDDMQQAVSAPESAAGGLGTWKYQWNYKMSTALLGGVPRPNIRNL